MGLQKDKKFKDPIYGYVEIPIEYVNEIIDMAEFQRLRRVVQTSYAPLYSSAVHNRFVHSIGVFHLGKLASKQVEGEIIKKFHCDFDIIKASQFNSGFGKPDFTDTNISFVLGHGEEKIAKVGNIVSSLKPRKTERDDFFYLFYKRGQGNGARLESQELCRRLIREFV